MALCARFADASARPSQLPAATAPTSSRALAPPAPASQRVSNAVAPAEEEEAALFDPSLNVRKRKPGLNLFQMGAVPQEHQDALHAAASAPLPDSAPLPRAPGIPEAPPEPPAPRIREPVPAVEWWDAAVLDQPTYDPGPDGMVALKEAKITNLIEHPVPIEPPVEKPPPAPQALKLTKKVRALRRHTRTSPSCKHASSAQTADQAEQPKYCFARICLHCRRPDLAAQFACSCAFRLVQEMKKIRKQRREEREKEKQINIQTGLMEPPKDKVRLVNMPRVYGADGVVDATKIQMEVRAAQREREAAHADRNLARKLTTTERKAKKLRKMFDDSAVDTHVQVRMLCSAHPCAWTRPAH
jgi:pre-mRNA processing factor 3 (PRP3)